MPIKTIVNVEFLFVADNYYKLKCYICTFLPIPTHVWIKTFFAVQMVWLTLSATMMSTEKQHRRKKPTAGSVQRQTDKALKQAGYAALISNLKGQSFRSRYKIFQEKVAAL